MEILDFWSNFRILHHDGTFHGHSIDISKHGKNTVG